MRIFRFAVAAAFVACGPSFAIAPELVADRAHARASGASAVSFDEDAGAPAVTSTPPVIPEIVERKLSNGIRVLLVPRHPIVDFAIVIKRGGEDAAPGFAHLWIEAATSSTKDLSRVPLMAWFRRRGAIVSRDAAYSHCTFGVKVITPLLEEALDQAANAVLRPSIDDEVLKKATSDHANAVLAARGAPGTIAYRTVLRSLFPSGHPYGETVVGEDVHPTLAEIETHSHDDVTASSVAIVAAGDFDAERFTSLLEARFGKLAGSAPAAKPIDAFVPHQRRGIVVAHAHDPQVQIAIGFPGVPVGDPDRAALHIASLALRDATLHDLRLIEGATYTTSVFESVRRGPAPIVFQTAVDPGRVAPAIQDIWHAIDRLHAGLAEQDTARFRARALAVYSSRFETVATMVAHLADMAALDLPITEFADGVAALEKVTAADVKRVADKYMTGETLQLAIVGEPTAVKPVEGLLEYRDANAAPP